MTMQHTVLATVRRTTVAYGPFSCWHSAHAFCETQFTDTEVNWQIVPNYLPNSRQHPNLPIK